jgi:hypothetical protein
MKKAILFLIASSILYGCKSKDEDFIPHNALVLSEMNSFIEGESNNSGLLFGYCDNGSTIIWTVGAIRKDDELRVACPTSKPILSYLILKMGIDLNTPISKWFPKKDGFTSSDSISVKMLMLNSSGIRDYVSLVPNHPDSIITI